MASRRGAPSGVWKGWGGRGWSPPFRKGKDQHYFAVVAATLKLAPAAWPGNHLAKTSLRSERLRLRPCAPSWATTRSCSRAATSRAGRSRRRSASAASPSGSRACRASYKAFQGFYLASTASPSTGLVRCTRLRPPLPLNAITVLGGIAGAATSPRRRARGLSPGATDAVGSIPSAATALLLGAASFTPLMTTPTHFQQYGDPT